ncbi:uncharacterized protein PFL1_04168 [Pseudozyma flocculosa PF-1]|uniref:RRM domain-containing protein n=2 Tax=Pseudozyma flocculosa TaxID=84751 RepID=A0A5C3ETY5_9BASI|nr:uncharacterized protein PFL1_04168 [Pseudozyma flocculosa PF-1]EPQ28341.1 hypothetical protein PFL1_04168 [Pseudozyma flocculosa PF-1]SPO35492.1 uncharacterized protein PSFLO_00963 [Pseudozyma flocculosa]
MSTSAPNGGVSLPRQYQSDPIADAELRNGTSFAMPRGVFPDDGASRLVSLDASSRFRQQGHLERTASPLSRGSFFGPGMLMDTARAGQAPAPLQHSSSPPPPKGAMPGADRIAEGRPMYPKGPLDFAPSPSPVSILHERPKSSLSDGTFAASRDFHQVPGRPAFAAGGGGGGSKEPEFSIFIGDLSPDLREEDLVTQFLQPPPWPPQHPFAIAHAHAQRMQGIHQPGARVGPAPFLSTKSAKIMTDPVTGASRGYGFVRFTREADCNRALIEMQGVVISPANGLSPGRPLRVSTATPKSRNSPNSVASASDAHPHPLQMPKPHHAAAEESAAYLLQHGLYGRNIASPQPRMHPPPPPQQHMMHFASPLTPSSPFEAGLNGQQGLAALHAQLPGYAGAGNDMLDRTVSPPSGRTFTPASAGSAAAAAAGGPPKPSAMDPNNTTVFVGGLSSLISEDTLRQFFEPYGEITYVKIPPGKGCGFVQFVHKADAERAINLMNGFPVGNARIRLSWGRSQGDKAAAAAAQAVQQASQLGHLAGLAGLSALTPSQLAQLAGLGSALSAAQASANRSSSGHSHFGGGDHAAFSNDPLSTLARQLAAANAGAASSNGSSAYRPAPVQQRPPSQPSALHHHHHQQTQQQQQQQQHPLSHQHQHQNPYPQHQHPQQQPLHHAPHHPFPPHQPSHMDGPDGYRHLQHTYESLASINPSTLQQLLAASNAPGLSDHIAGRTQPAQPQHMYPAAGNGASDGHDLAHAFASLHFADAPRGPPVYKSREGTGPNDGAHGTGYTRDPSAFLFSPFSPADSPVVGGKTELPPDGNDDHLQRTDARRDADSGGGIEA